MSFCIYQIYCIYPFGILNIILQFNNLADEKHNIPLFFKIKKMRQYLTRKLKGLSKGLS